MIKLKAEDESGVMKEWEVSYEEFERLISTGEADPDLEACSDNLTQGQWKRLGELTLYKKAAAARDGGGSLAMRELVERTSMTQPPQGGKGGTMWTCSSCGHENEEHLTECLWCKASKSTGRSVEPAGAIGEPATSAANAPKFCSGCGAKLAPSARFCDACGAASAGGSSVADHTVQARAVLPQKKPSSLRTLAVLTLVSGIWNCVTALFGFLAYQSQVAPIVARYAQWGQQLPAKAQLLQLYLVAMIVYCIVLGIMEILYATRLLPDPVKVSGPAKYLAVMEIAAIASGSWFALIVGCVALSTYGKDKVKNYFVRLK